MPCIYTVILIAIGSVLAGCVAPPQQAPATGASDPVRLGTVYVDAPRREVIATGYVNQVEGLIELFACGPGGKVHESIFVLQAEPKDIQAGLLLLGLQPAEIPAAGLGQGPPQGSELIIEVVWAEDGNEQRMAAERLVFDYKTRKPVRHGGWIFNGSLIKDGYFMADAEDSIVATYWDPWAVLNIGNLGDDDDRLGVNKQLIPPHLTPVRIVFRAPL